MVLFKYFPYINLKFWAIKDNKLWRIKYIYQNKQSQTCVFVSHYYYFNILCISDYFTANICEMVQNSSLKRLSKWQPMFQSFYVIHAISNNLSDFFHTMKKKTYGTDFYFYVFFFFFKDKLANNCIWQLEKWVNFLVHQLFKYNN